MDDGRIRVKIHGHPRDGTRLGQREEALLLPRIDTISTSTFAREREKTSPPTTGERKEGGLSERKERESQRTEKENGVRGKNG